MTSSSHNLPKRASGLLLALLVAVALAACAGSPKRKAPARGKPAPARGKRIELPPPPGQCPVAPAPKAAEKPAPRPALRPPEATVPPFPAAAPEERKAAADRTVRVLLSGPSKSIATVGCPLRAWRDDGVPAGVWDGALEIAADGGRIRIGGTLVEGPVELGGDAPFEVAGRQMASGRVRILNRQGKLLAVAELPLEEYVAAVLSREASPSFAPAALSALAVAIRTYAVNAAAKPRDPAFDLLNGVDDQVFEGFARMQPQFRAAAGSTRGVLLYVGDSPAPANYHSTCGGRTESAADAWGKPFPHLVSVACDDCRESPAWRWEYRLSFEEAKRVAQSLGLRAGRDLRIEIVSLTPTGRAARVRLTSGGNTREAAAAAFRQAAGTTRLRSLKMTIRKSGDGWRITGDGYGHGVGLCQWGADGMARRGADYREILGRYYPGARLDGGAS
jgi:stage II sporulation protein D